LHFTASLQEIGLTTRLHALMELHKSFNHRIRKSHLLKTARTFQINGFNLNLYALYIRLLSVNNLSFDSNLSLVSPKKFFRPSIFKFELDKSKSGRVIFQKIASILKVKAPALKLGSESWKIKSVSFSWWTLSHKFMEAMLQNVLSNLKITNYHY